ncbi:MAG: 1,6-anhydro-N-acetylmuramyl-L-alanine amidase AmpD [Betaproteobacteria bacterium]|nr:1,6-anhydro-N-acetylmuramyl-L-alanine amidase AmpD [Betaproteobacteria bacterium]
MRLDPEGWIEGIRHVVSPNCDDRPPRESITLLVLHSISLPPREYGGDAVERFFGNRLDPTEHPYYRELAGLKVSAHFFVRRSGEVIQFVSVWRRAWHAGKSCWRGRERCNDFSVGVELEGSDDSPFVAPQYERLHTLQRCLRAAMPLRDVAAHSDIAPQRKTDPGTGFDWHLSLRQLAFS